MCLHDALLLIQRSQQVLHQLVVQLDDFFHFLCLTSASLCPFAEQLVQGLPEGQSVVRLELEAALTILDSFDFVVAVHLDERKNGLAILLLRSKRRLEVIKTVVMKPLPDLQHALGLHQSI